MVLLFIKNDHPVLEYSEIGAHYFDWDSNEKLLSILLPDKSLSNRDFFKLRSLDATFIIMEKA